MFLQVPDTAIDHGTHSTKGFRTTTHEATVQGVDDTWRTGNEKDVPGGNAIDLDPENRLSARQTATLRPPWEQSISVCK